MAFSKLFAVRSGKRSFIALVTGHHDKSISAERATPVEVGVDGDDAKTKEVISTLTIPLELVIGPAKETKLHHRYAFIL